MKNKKQKFLSDDKQSLEYKKDINKIISNFKDKLDDLDLFCFGELGINIGKDLQKIHNKLNKFYIEKLK